MNKTSEIIPNPIDENAISSNFIQNIISEDLKASKNDGKLSTRFPPEPNGYLHIGHAKSICLNFGTALKNNGTCNLRFDDTNPDKEDIEFVESIKKDIKWLGFDWEDRIFFASDYFEQLYQYAIQLIKLDKAYICSLSSDEIKDYRGTLTTPGKDSPYRNRTVEENLSLFEKMRNGEFSEGSHVLRAKIDMSSPNLNMRDPTIYRIKFAEHHRTGNKWCIYPMYDFTHCLSDSIEEITHSLCTLEFEDHRPLYDWFLKELHVACHPQQIEFARLNLTFTVMSKRMLLGLVKNKYVSGWNDPRMPTISGFRRKGYPPKAIRDFCDRIGVAKRETLVDMDLLEHFVREELNIIAPRVMVVLNPLKVTIENYPENQSEEFEALNNPGDPTSGSRKISFSKTIYIEKDDFRVDAPKKFFRLAPNKEVRLKHAYYITCKKVIMDDNTNEVKELICTYDPESRGGDTADKRKVKGTLHWVSKTDAINIEVHLYNHLFKNKIPFENDDSTLEDEINPNSLKILKNSLAEASLQNASVDIKYQFLRNGYFCLDEKLSNNDKLVFLRTVSLKDSWGKIEKKQT